MPKQQQAPVRDALGEYYDALLAADDDPRIARREFPDEPLETYDDRDWNYPRS